jgi:hypothetical protein
MKKYIREMLNDLKLGGEKDRVPEVPKAPADAKTVHLDPPKAEPIPEDLNNQILSKDAEQRVRQLDYQAQKSEERQTLG